MLFRLSLFIFPFVFLTGCVTSSSEEMRKESYSSSELEEFASTWFFYYEQNFCVFKRLIELESSEAIIALGVSKDDICKFNEEYEKLLEKKFILMAEESRLLKSWCEVYGLNYIDFKSECKNLQTSWSETRFIEER